MRRVGCAVIAAVLCASSAYAAEEQAAKKVTASIFVKNTTGKELRGREAAFRDLLAAKLTDKGYALIDAASFTAKDVANDAGVVRVGQSLGADYVLVASLVALTHKDVAFKGKASGYGSDVAKKEDALTVAVSVLDRAKGASITADTVTARAAQAEGAFGATGGDATLDELFDDATTQIAVKMADRAGVIAAVKPDTAKQLSVEFVTNVPGATVELDGAAVGTTPCRVNAAAGFHSVRVFKDNYRLWENTVAVSGGQTFEIALEPSEEGLANMADQQDMALKQQVVDTATYATKAIADGEKEKRKHSYEHDDGFAKNLKDVVHGGK